MDPQFADIDTVTWQTSRGGEVIKFNRCNNSCRTLQTAFVFPKVPDYNSFHIVTSLKVKLCDPLVTHGPYLSVLAVVLPIVRRCTYHRVTLLCLAMSYKYCPLVINTGSRHTRPWKWSQSIEQLKYVTISDRCATKTFICAGNTLQGESKKYSPIKKTFLQYFHLG